MFHATPLRRYVMFLQMITIHRIFSSLRRCVVA